PAVAGICGRPLPAGRRRDGAGEAGRGREPDGDGCDGLGRLQHLPRDIRRVAVWEAGMRNIMSTAGGGVVTVALVIGTLTYDIDAYGAAGFIAAVTVTTIAAGELVLHIIRLRNR